jgi:transposase
LIACNQREGTKVHLITNAMGLPVRAEITGGEVSDYKGYDALFDGDLPAAKVLIADKGYGSDHIRTNVERRGGASVIPSRSNRMQAVPVDGFIYALRNQIERCFNKLKCSRRFATRYDKTAASYLGIIHIVAARL